MMDLSFWLHDTSGCMWWLGVSILVMMDLSFWQSGTNNLYSTLLTFQSLLWWICHFDFTWKIPIGHSVLIVSILVMMDLSFWHDIFILHSYAWLMFQSLLWWICHFDNRYCLLCILRLLVSILVMMDLSFWQDGVVSSDFYNQLSRFNPCYDGFVILTFIHCVTTDGIFSFNPCYDGFVILT